MSDELSDELYVWWAYFHDQIVEFTNNTEEFAVGLIVAGAFCFFLEKLRPVEPRTNFFKKEFNKELGLAVFNELITTPVMIFILSITIVAILQSYAPYRFFDEEIQQWPFILQTGAGLLIIDFSSYWRHRFTHRYMWPYHSIHHSAEEITWLTSLRLHPTDVLAALVFDTVVLYFVGFNGPGIAAAAIVMRFYNYFTHLNLNIRFGAPLRYILASPHYHRWHHANQKKAYDKNFCGMFSLYDVIFGTYYHPEDLPEVYGLAPHDQQEVPPGLFAHIALPVKKDFKKLFGKKI